MVRFRFVLRLTLSTALSAVWVAGPALAQPVLRSTDMVTAQPAPNAAVTPFVTDLASEPKPARDQLIAELRQKVKYVFVVFNENHSFDNEYGTFPGANGIYADATGPRDAAATPGFTQSWTDSTGATHTQMPFRIGPDENATYLDSVDHSHTGLARKLGVVDGKPTMSGFAAADYARLGSRGGAAFNAMGNQFARLVMAHTDCDTTPFFWNWANRFTLFDNIFATEDTPSTPNAIAMFAGQSGETQWVKHGSTPVPAAMGNHKGNLQAAPIVNDPQPLWGSQYDATKEGRQPDNQADGYGDNNIATNLTFANLGLTFSGRELADKMKQDRNAAVDQADIAKDIPFITDRAGTPVNWRWYQEGYDHEPNEAAGEASHAGYISHHQAPQYFGYIANNPAFAGNLRGVGDFFNDIKANGLPKDNGVFYIRGGGSNLAGLTPPIQNPNFPGALTEADRATIARTKHGDDDHPGYTDRQISEAMAARVINAVASNPELWAQSAIVLTYDESDGFYDHVAPRVLSYGPDGLPLARGVRIPLMLISPYARAHVVSHAEGDHNAVIETINEIFDLPALASLPEEKAALISGQDAAFNGPNGFVQHHLGPRDINTPEMDDLLSGFDPRRLDGSVPPLPASYAMTDEAVVNTLPHYAGKGCTAIGMTPVDRALGIHSEVPAHFNTMPSTLPAYN